MVFDEFNFFIPIKLKYEYLFNDKTYLEAKTVLSQLCDKVDLNFIL